MRPSRTSSFSSFAERARYLPYKSRSLRILKPMALLSYASKKSGSAKTSSCQLSWKTKVRYLLPQDLMLLRMKRFPLKVTWARLSQQSHSTALISSTSQLRLELKSSCLTSPPWTTCSNNTKCCCRVKVSTKALSLKVYRTDRKMNSISETAWSVRRGLSSSNWLITAKKM